MGYELMLMGAMCFFLGMVAELIFQNSHGVIDLDVRIENAILSETNKKLGEENEQLRKEINALNDFIILEPLGDVE